MISSARLTQSIYIYISSQNKKKALFGKELGRDGNGDTVVPMRDFKIKAYLNDV